MIQLALIIVAFIVTCAVLVALLRGLLAVTALFAAFSLGFAVLWLVLAAPNVALTEAAVGAGAMVILLLITARTTGVTGFTENEPLRSVNLPALVILTSLALALGYSVLAFPRLGDPTAPAVRFEDPAGMPTPYSHYVGETAAGLGLPNAVSSVLVVFRGLDTFGEVVVVFGAVVGVLIVFDRSGIVTHSKSQTRDPAQGSIEGRSDDATPDPYVMSPVGLTAVRLVVPLVFVFGVYVTLHGAVLPGGGFPGGIIIGSSFLLTALVFGHSATSEWIRKRRLYAALVAGVWLFVMVASGGVVLNGAILSITGYPVPVIYVVDLVEVAIGVAVGGGITALVFTMATEPEGLGAPSTDELSRQERGEQK